MCFQFTPGFMLLASFLWLLDTSGLLSALLPAVAIHELGHAAALRLFGARITLLRFEACGLRMDYGGCLTEREELLSALAGPASGAVYALAAALLGKGLQSEFFFCSAGISLCLSLFNLLPAPMLDGGRALSALGCKALWKCGLAAGIALLVSATLFLRSGFALLLLAAGLWVTIGTCKYSAGGIK